MILSREYIAGCPAHIGTELDQVTLADLGTARRVVIDNDNTTIVDGAGSADEIKARVEQIRAQVEKETREVQLELRGQLMEELADAKYEQLRKLEV